MATQADIESRKSALPDSEANKYGDGVTNPADSIFDDVDFSDTKDEPVAPKNGTQTPKPKPKPAPTPEPEPEIIEEEEEEVIEGEAEEEGVNEEESTDDPADESVIEIGDEEGEVSDEVEVTKEELEFLRGKDKDYAIAKFLSARKGNATFQQKFDKVQKVVGKEVMDEIVKGGDTKWLQTLVTDAQDPNFQSYVNEFYEYYQRDTSGQFKRVKDKVPTPDFLKSFMEVNNEIAALDIQEFMPEGESFDGTDAYMKGTDSYIAKRKYDLKSAELNQKLESMIDQSASSGTDSATQVDQEEVARTNQKLFTSLVERHKPLQKTDTQKEFMTFMRASQDDLLEVFYKAFLQSKASRKKSVTLLLKESRTVENNKTKIAQPSEKVTKQKRKSSGKIPADLDPKFTDSFQSDNELFGDLS